MAKKQQNGRAALIAELQQSTMCVALRKEQFGRRRSWTDEQVCQAAEVFGADPDYVRGNKKLLNDKHDAYRKVVSIINQARTAWMGFTTPFPETGRRLMRRDRLEEWEAKMTGLKAELAAAVTELDAVYPELKEEAKVRLKDLFDATNYPETLAGEFSISWDYPSTDPPEYLLQLNPSLYEAEKRKLEARFDEAIVLLEQGLIAELHKIVAGLVDRLTPQDVIDWVYEGPDAADLESRAAELRQRAFQIEAIPPHEVDDDAIADAEAIKEELREVAAMQEMQQAADIEQRGEKITFKPGGSDAKRASKTFTSYEDAVEWLCHSGCRAAATRKENKRIQASAIGNLKEFFDRFAQVSVRSNAQLDALVEQAKAAVSGVDVEALKVEGVQGATRQSLREAMSGLASALDGMVVAGGTRNINFADED